MLRGFPNFSWYISCTLQVKFFWCSCDWQQGFACEGAEFISARNGEPEGVAGVHTSSLAWNSATYVGGKPLQFSLCKCPQTSKECLPWPHKYVDVFQVKQGLVSAKSGQSKYSWCLSLD